MKSLVSPAVAVVCLLLAAAPAVARQESASAAADETSLVIEEGPEAGGLGGTSLNVFSAWDFVRMVLILGAVIGAIYGIFFLLRKSGGARFLENRQIRLLSSKALTNNRSLHLVEVGNQVFLVGSSENSVSLVAEITDRETVDGLKLQAAEAAPTEQRSFSAVLGQVFGVGQGPRRTATAADPAGFLRSQRERLKKIG